MFDKKILRNNAIVFLIAGVLFGILGLPWVGLIAFLISIINLLIGLVLLLAKRKKQALSFLVCSGVLLLIGFSICSTSTVH